MKALQNTIFFPFMQPTAVHSEKESLLCSTHKILQHFEKNPIVKNIERIYKNICMDEAEE
jgi:hypothetical protein